MTSRQWLFCKVEHTTLLYHHTTTQGKANAAAVALCRKEGYKERLAVLCWDGQTVITNVKHELLMIRRLLYLLYNHSLRFCLHCVLR